MPVHPFLLPSEHRTGTRPRHQDHNLVQMRQAANARLTISSETQHLGGAGEVGSVLT